MLFGVIAAPFTTTPNDRLHLPQGGAAAGARGTPTNVPRAPMRSGASPR